MTILKALDTLATQQAQPTQFNKSKIKQLLDYLSTHPDEKFKLFFLRYVLQTHSDTAFMIKEEALQVVTFLWEMKLTTMNLYA